MIFRYTMTLQVYSIWYSANPLRIFSDIHVLWKKIPVGGLYT